MSKSNGALILERVDNLKEYVKEFRHESREKVQKISERVASNEIRLVKIEEQHKGSMGHFIPFVLKKLLFR